MPDDQNNPINSQTLVIDEDQFSFEPIEQHNGIATVVRFKLDNPSVQVGDVLLILSGDQIHFHGFIGKIDDGWAMAVDRNGSLLPATIH